MMKITGALLFLVVLFSSCTEEKFLLVFNRVSVKHYPADTPFVYNVKVDVAPQNITPADEKLLTDNLPDYLDDSLRSRKTQRFGIFYRIKNPPVLDTQNISRSETFMKNYLQAQGYYRSQVEDSVYVDTFKQQQRATVVFKVEPGKVTIIDSLSYDLASRRLDQIADREAVQKNSLIKQGKSPFSKALIGSELDRLVTVFKNRGYLLFSRDNLYAEADTFNTSLLQLPVDPFEQVETIEAAESKKAQNPTATIAIRLRDINDSTDLVDSSQLVRYRVGHIYFYPETRYTQVPDSLQSQPPPVLYTDSAYTMYGREGLFKFAPLRRNSFLTPGEFYRERLFAKTITNLSSVGAWQNIESRTHIRDSNIVDFHYFLVPAEKENITISLEASRNTGGDFVSTGNLFGLALNATYINRNVWHRAVQATTSLVNGVELNLNQNYPFLQTFQSSLTHAYTFPHIIIPAVKRALIRKNNENINLEKTTISMGARYSERNNFFRLRSLVSNMAFDWRIKNKYWQLKVPNVELYSLDTLSLLKQQFTTNPFLRTAFNTGSIVSVIVSFTSAYSPSKHAAQNNYYHFAIEEAGGLTGFIQPLQNKLYRYIKMEGEFRKAFNFPRTSFVTRAFGGVGYNYGKVGSTLPFYKQFVAGGPNSMRAWSLRQLGLGSSLVSDTAGTKNSAFRDRYGDVQLEVNLEYRYRIAEFSSLRLGGAVFADMGNIWNLKKDMLNPLGTFQLSRLARDIAIGVGTGLRFDFSYFLVRIDGAIKVKDPARRENGGWMGLSNFAWQNHEYERKDATGNIISPNRNNYAIQLGIGLPF